jgi:hypothetical protein
MVEEHRLPQNNGAASKAGRPVTRFRCVVCGKLTAGRIPPPDGSCQADRSERFPRRHKATGGAPCKGNLELAEWVTEAA